MRSYIRFFRRCTRPALAIFGIVLLPLAATACDSHSSAASDPALTPVPPGLLATAPPPTPRPGAAASPIAGPAAAIENFNFTPATITVPAGATVTWVNHDDVPHTVTASDNSYTSQPIDTDASFTHTFTAPGTYAYYCAIHPFMTAKVVVQ